MPGTENPASGKSWMVRRRSNKASKITTGSNGGTMSKERILLECKLPPGDVLTLTAAVRDLHRAHPGRFAVNVRTAFPDIWKNSPYIDYGVTESNITRPVLNMQYKATLDRARKTHDTHFINGYREDLEKHLNLRIPLTEKKPDVHFTGQEAMERPLPHKYWVMFAGGKEDCTTKPWHAGKFQMVVDHFSASDFQFVQVGSRDKGRYNPKLSNVIDMTGKTTFRELMWYVLHAEGVLCPVTCGLHLAAACQTPCVVIAGGREGPWWEQYPGQTYLHTIGDLECCKNAGCWKSYVDIKDTYRRAGLREASLEDREKYMCVDVVDDGVQLQPRCMDMISVNHVIKAIEFHRESDDPGHPITRASTSSKLASPEGVTAIAVCLYGTSEEKNICSKVGEDAFEKEPSMCYHDLHVRCLRSIVSNTPPGSYKLYLGMNDVDPRTWDWVAKNLVNPGVIDVSIVETPGNTLKYPMMKALYSRLQDEKWVVWFDDDSFVTSDLWLQRVWGHIKEGKGSVFGKMYSITSVRGQWDWVKAADWYQGKEPWKTKLQHGLNYPVFMFPTGGFHVVKRSVLKQLDWPDPRIEHNGGDVMFGEACRQKGIEMVDIFKSANPGVIISGARRRGFAQAPAGSVGSVKYQKVGQ